MNRCGYCLSSHEAMLIANRERLHAAIPTWEHAREASFKNKSHLDNPIIVKKQKDATKPFSIVKKDAKKPEEKITMVK